jgi:glycosyltransferase involved in cell wall biosynthesis
LYVGRLSKEKNLLLLPPMMARLSRQSHTDYRLLVAGDGPLANALRASFEHQAPRRAFFLGHCRREDLSPLYHASDIFIHPNEREPFGIAPLEAMAAQLPVVAPASGGVLTYANSENVWLAANTPDSFAEAVASVHANHQLRRGKVERARRTAEEFSWVRIAQNYFRTYDQFHSQSLRAGLVKAALPARAPVSEHAPSLREIL